jgi:septum formation protein
MPATFVIFDFTLESLDSITNRRSGFFITSIVCHTNGNMRKTDFPSAFIGIVFPHTINWIYVYNMMTIAKSPTLILASTSRYRHELLTRLQLPFIAVAPHVDELAYQNESVTPHLLACTLAHAKAIAVLNSYLGPEATVVIGSDQLVDLDGSVLGKPGSAEAAEEQLIRMAGKCHRLLTAVCVSSHERTYQFINEARLWMRPLSHLEIKRYVAREQPFDCAGSYKIEQSGIALFDRIECEDFTAINGLPLLELSAELRLRGYLVP